MSTERRGEDRALVESDISKAEEAKPEEMGGNDDNSAYLDKVIEDYNRAVSQKAEHEGLAREKDPWTIAVESSGRGGLSLDGNIGRGIRLGL